MNRARRWLVFGAGVALGCLLLSLLPWRPAARPEHPWHAQTAPEGAFPMTVRDGYGRTVEIPRQPRWVASLAPSVTETLQALGLGDHLLAITQWCVPPPGGEGLPRLGTLDQPNREKILELRPDLVLGSNLTPRRVYDQLAEQGVRAVQLDYSTWPASRRSVAETARLLGVPGAAVRLLASWDSRRAAVHQALAGAPRPPVRAVLLYDLDKLFSAGAGSWPGDFLEELGARNLAAEAASAWPQLSFEALLAGAPEVILLTAPVEGPRRALLQRRVEELDRSAAWAEVPAVRQKRVVLLPEDLFLIPGPRLIEAYEAMARALHPEAFPAAHGG